MDELVFSVVNSSAMSVKLSPSSVLSVKEVIEGGYPNRIKIPPTVCSEWASSTLP